MLPFCSICTFTEAFDLEECCSFLCVMAYVALACYDSPGKICSAYQPVRLDLPVEHCKTISYCETSQQTTLNLHSIHLANL